LSGGLKRAAAAIRLPQAIFTLLVKIVTGQ
jgi:hypothetical protein